MKLTWQWAKENILLEMKRYELAVAEKNGKVQAARRSIEFYRPGCKLVGQFSTEFF